MMFILTLIWSVSLALLLVEGGTAYVRSRGSVLNVAHSETSIREFVSGEMFAMLQSSYDALRHLLPHGRRAFFIVSVQGRRASDMFVKRIFGRIEMKRGTASSFFLKHLAEHQEMDRRNASERQGL